MKIIIHAVAATFLVSSSCSQANLEALQMVRRYLPLNPIIIEVGAGHGASTELLCRIWPRGMIYAIEPSPEQLGDLQAHLLKIPNVWIHPIALTDKNEQVPFYLCENNKGASSTLPAKGPIDDLTFKDPIMVDGMTFDYWATLEGLHRIDFLWLDMEGNEMQMLKSATKFLPVVRAILIEVNGQEFRTGTALYPEVREWLESQGFMQVWISCEPVEWQANALFVRQ
jgi:FkbM family methyltransferase